ncbi:MAG: winged helix-turn-helix transcriptional regulator [Candidatus Eremiobacteraeota bacterium]|nr:winged helix-turn-helix transcriptional regulator [Candidatus Eremiobacteraeota bacterium]
MLNIAPLPAVAPVQSLEALRAVSDSQRHKILGLLIEEPLTPTVIAKRLHIARTRVYYHIDILKKHGFIAVVDERPVAAMIERTYRALARTFHVDRRMLSATATPSAIDEAQALLLERTAEDLRARPHATTTAASDSEDVLVARSFFRLQPADAHALRDELNALVTKYGNRQRDDAETFELTMALFPTTEERNES